MMLRRVLAFGVVFVLLGTVGFGESKKNVIYSERSEWVATLSVACLGTIDARGKFKMELVEWMDESGGYHYSGHHLAYNISAVDADGNQYTGVEAAHLYRHDVAAGDGFPFEWTYMISTRWQSHGAAPNVIAKWRVRTTVNGVGEATVSRELHTVECIPD